jgi:hypothetical protein
LEEYLSRDDIYEEESPFGKAINQSVNYTPTVLELQL